MYKKKWFLLVSIIILVIISSYIYGFLELRSGDRDFAIPLNAEVSSVHLVSPDSEKIELEKDDKDQWWVDNVNYANEAAVRDMLRTIRYFSVRQPVSRIKKDTINKNLDQQGVMVNVYVEDYIFNFFDLFGVFKTQRKARSFLVGDNTDDQTEIDGTYMRMTQSDEPYIVYRAGYGGIANTFTTKEHIWFDPVVVDLKAEQIDRVKVVSDENYEDSFILDVYEDLDFDFYDLDNNLISKDINVDTTKVLRFLSSFSNLYYETLLTDKAYSRSEDLIFPEYAYKIVIEDWHNNEYKLYIYRRYKENNRDKENMVTADYDPDRFYLVLENEQRAVAQYYVFGRIMRTLSFFETDDVVY